MGSLLLFEWLELPWDWGNLRCYDRVLLIVVSFIISNVLGCKVGVLIVAILYKGWIVLYYHWSIYPRSTWWSALFVYLQNPDFHLKSRDLLKIELLLVVFVQITCLPYRSK